MNIINFRLSEKHTKFKKNLPHGFDKSADLLSKRQNHEEDLFQIMCASQKVRFLKPRQKGLLVFRLLDLNYYSPYIFLK